MTPPPRLDRRRPIGWRRWSGRHVEGWTLLRLLIAAGAVWAFVAIADEVMEGGTRAFDTRMLLALRDGADPVSPYGPGWLQELVRDVTAFGSVGILTLIVLAASGVLWIQGNRRSLVLVLTAVGSGMILSSLLKSGFDRPRPDLVPHGSIVYTASFPSGHAMLSAVTYLTLAALVARVQPRRPMKIYILTLASLLTAAVGISRVYLGVHWPTDVLAGWFAGAAWALLWWVIATWLETEGVVEREQVEEDKPAVSSDSYCVPKDEPTPFQ